jgi:hypothetical protein
MLQEQRAGKSRGEDEFGSYKPRDQFVSLTRPLPGPCDQRIKRERGA